MDEEDTSSLFDLLTNGDMEVIAVQVVALAETIRHTVAESVSEQQAAKMDYTSDRGPHLHSVVPRSISGTTGRGVSMTTEQKPSEMVETYVPSLEMARGERPFWSPSETARRAFFDDFLQVQTNIEKPQAGLGKSAFREQLCFPGIIADLSQAALDWARVHALSGRSALKGILKRRCSRHS